MLRKELRMIGRIALVVGMALGLAMSGLAQEATPTPTQIATARPTVAVEITATPTVMATATLTLTETPTTAAIAVREEAAATPEAVLISASPRAVVAGESEAVELTVYNQNQNLGLVKDIRTLALERGENRVLYTHVASQIEPASVHFQSLTDPEGTAVREQNYEYDIASSQKLLGKYLGETISLTTQAGATFTGTLLSGADDVILSTSDGIKIVKLAQVQEFSLPQLLEGLVTEPTLIWVLDAATRGQQRVRVTYLTSGINWQADYIAMLAPDEGSLSLASWVTLDNRSGASYEEAMLKLVAGDIHLVSQPRVLAMAAAEVPRAIGVPQVEEQAFFEFHIYQITRPITVRDRETKQIEFIAVPEVAVEKVYAYEASPRIIPSLGGAVTDPNYGLESDTKVQVRLEFTNDEESGLGLPLPRGVVRIYKEDVDGSAELVGEDSIDHTPVDEKLSLRVGDAFDVVGERVQTRFRQLAERSIEETYRITLRNHKTEDIVVRVIEHLFRAQDAEIVSSNADYVLLDANTVQYSVPLEADGEAEIEYTVRYRW